MTRSDAITNEDATAPGGMCAPSRCGRRLGSEVLARKMARQRHGRDGMSRARRRRPESQPTTNLDAATLPTTRVTRVISSIENYTLRSRRTDNERFLRAVDGYKSLDRLASWLSASKMANRWDHAGDRDNSGVGPRPAVGSTAHVGRPGADVNQGPETSNQTFASWNLIGGFLRQIEGCDRPPGSDSSMHSQQRALEDQRHTKDNRLRS